MTGPDGIGAAACLVLVVDGPVSARSWRDLLSPLVEVRTLSVPEAVGGAGPGSVVADWPADRPWALFVSGAAAPGLVARVAEVGPAPSRVFVASSGGVLADPVAPPVRPVTVVLAEDASEEERARAASWAPAGEHAGDLVVRLVPAGQEPPAACHPHLARGVREDLSLP
ncbi:hypothetical protein [Nocardiopsis sp. RV163]|uniref:hypothetical protein n=1 Tax=Nocardiopsis sp. RV163 TaxID=1661388 RepID=UPI000A8371B4|nr:hypothetical protein [Nocardiopsis sp. RV163]